MDDELSIEPDDLRGGWANAIRTARRFDEFTVDFLRADPFEPRAALVARVIASPSLIGELRDALDGLWHDYVRNAMPPEVQGDDG